MSYENTEEYEQGFMRMKSFGSVDSDGTFTITPQQVNKYLNNEVEYDELKIEENKIIKRLEMIKKEKMKIKLEYVCYCDKTLPGKCYCDC